MRKKSFIPFMWIFCQFDFIWNLVNTEFLNSWVKSKLGKFVAKLLPKYSTKKSYICFLKLILYIYLFLTVLGLCCCLGLSLVVVSRGYCLVIACGLLIGVALLLQSTGSRAHRLSTCGMWAQQLQFPGFRAQAQ